jgi:hypothetical protein
VLFRTIDFGWFTPLAIQKACEGEKYGKMKRIWNMEWYFHEKFMPESGQKGPVYLRTGVFEMLPPGLYKIARL